MNSELKNVPFVHLQAGPGGVPVAVAVGGGAAVGRRAAAVAGDGDGEVLRRDRRGRQRGQGKNEGGKRRKPGGKAGGGAAASGQGAAATAASADPSGGGGAQTDGRYAWRNAPPRAWQAGRDGSSWRCTLPRKHPRRDHTPTGPTGHAHRRRAGSQVNPSASARAVSSNGGCARWAGIGRPGTSQDRRGGPWRRRRGRSDEEAGGGRKAARLPADSAAIHRPERVTHTGDGHLTQANHPPGFRGGSSFYPQILRKTPFIGYCGLSPKDSRQPH